jgi:hypothetical protein
MGARILRLPPIAAALLALGCQLQPATPLPPVSGSVCEGLAYVMFLIADHRDHGRSRQEQLEMARNGVGNPFSAQPERTLQSWQHLIELVYREENASAAEVRVRTLERCDVNERGQAILLWPKGG